MTRRSLGRLALVAAGYAGAWYAAEAAVWWKNRGVSAADQLAMSGMFAFGDSLLFLAVFAGVAVVPTLVAFEAVRRAPRFWRAYAAGTLVLSSTAAVAGVLMFAPSGTRSGALESLRSISVLRVLAAPLFLLVAAPGLLPAAAPSRKLSAIACACELFAMGSFVVWLATRPR